MLKLFQFTLRQFLFWTSYFIILQGVFLLFFMDEVKEASINHVLQTFVAGFLMNLASAAYFTLPFFLILFSSVFVPFNSRKVMFIIATSLLSVTSLIYITDLALYQNWGSRINGKALWYLQFPGTITSSASNTGHLKFVFAVLIISSGFWLLHKKFFAAIPSISKHPIKLMIGFVLIVGSLFIALRGGLGGRPIGKSWSYFSKYPMLNYAAINGFWNFFDIVSHYKSQGNPYHFFNEDELKSYSKNLGLSQKNDAIKLTSSNKMNVLFVYLESWSADAVGCLNGQPDVTPGFDSLAKSSLLFTNFYSTGFRTEQGLMATLSGFPAQAQSYPMEAMERFENYPSLVRVLDSAGYFTSYFTGGNPAFANTDSYLKSSGIKKINSLLKTAKRRSAWGALDEETFSWVLNEVNQQPQPFFSSMVTLTSHEWFEAPVRSIFTEKDAVAARYKNTMHYTDSCLHDFIKKAEKKSWYANTLIIVMADHASNYPVGRQINQIERYHIPMLITGGALDKQWQGKAFTDFCGHLCIPALILDELKVSHAQFNLSQNPLNVSNSKAYFTYDHGFGVLTDKEILVFDMNIKKPIRQTKNGKQDLENYGKYLMQTSAQMKEDFQTIKKSSKF